jgi:hypothetical protein
VADARHAPIPIRDRAAAVVVRRNLDESRFRKVLRPVALAPDDERDVARRAARRGVLALDLRQLCARAVGARSDDRTRLVDKIPDLSSAAVRRDGRLKHVKGLVGARITSGSDDPERDSHALESEGDVFDGRLDAALALQRELLEELVADEDDLHAAILQQLRLPAAARDEELVALTLVLRGGGARAPPGAPAAAHRDGAAAAAAAARRAAAAATMAAAATTRLFPSVARGPGKLQPEERGGGERDDEARRVEPAVPAAGPASRCRSRHLSGGGGDMIATLR